MGHQPCQCQEVDEPDAQPALVYALGRVDVRVPSLAIENELAQVVADASYDGLTERSALQRALSIEQNRYLARSMGSVLTIEGLDMYVLAPRESRELDLLVEAVREQPSDQDLDVVIGIRTTLAPTQMCGGLTLPIVLVDQLYSFDRGGLVDALPQPKAASRKATERFRSTASGLLDDLAQLAANGGTADEHRALNYLVVRYPRLYEAAAEKLDRDVAFSGVEMHRSPLSGARSIVEVVLCFAHQETGVVERELARVDVTERYPFLVTELAPYRRAGL